MDRERAQKLVKEVDRNLSVAGEPYEEQMANAVAVYKKLMETYANRGKIVLSGVMLTNMAAAFQNLTMGRDGYRAALEDALCTEEAPEPEPEMDLTLKELFRMLDEVDRLGPLKDDEEKE